MMSTKVIVRVIIGAIIVTLLVIIYIFQREKLQNETQTSSDMSVAQETKQTEEQTESSIATDRLKSMAESIESLEDAVATQQKFIDKLSEETEVSATKEPEISGQKILADAHIRGPAFSTSATSYSAMNTFVNIVCSAKCTLWIDFYTTSKNDTANNVNTYGIFLNGQDQSLSSQAIMPVVNGAVPISLSGAISTNAGTHTVEIRAKTSGGTLQTDTSFLKVLAIERL